MIIVAVIIMIKEGDEEKETTQRGIINNMYYKVLVYKYYMY